MAAKFAVTGDQYRDIDRRMTEIKRQLLQQGGCPLDPDEVLRALQVIVETRPVPCRVHIHLGRLRRALRAVGDGESFTWLDPMLSEWKALEERNVSDGQGYEARLHQFDYMVKPAEVRAFFARDGFAGNAIAFAQWAVEHDGQGDYCCMVDSADYHRPTRGSEYVPFYHQGERGRILEMRGVAARKGVTFVAFRRLQPR